MQLQDRFYKSTEVADILGVSLRTLYRYMDSQKIESVQLPSGRHRFTKKQIEDFLYSNNLSSRDSGGTTNTSAQQGSSTLVDDTVPKQQTAQNTQPVQNLPQNTVVQQPVQSNESQTTQPQVQSEKGVDEDQKLEEELDALLASLDDDFSDVTQEKVAVEETVEVEKTFSDLQDSLNESPAPQPAAQPAPATSPEVSQSKQQSVQSTSGIFGLSEEPIQKQPEVTPAPKVLDEEKVNYFYCPYNDLRTVAKMVKKVGDDKGVDYAFTMNAGLSLFFPLDPFSVIHFYINEKDLDLWKSELQLKDTNTEEANLGILMTQGRAFEGSREVSGLKVVSKVKLLENLKSHNMSSLAEQAESKLD